MKELLGAWTIIVPLPCALSIVLGHPLCSSKTVNSSMDYPSGIKLEIKTRPKLAQINDTHTWSREPPHHTWAITYRDMTFSKSTS